MPEEVAREVAVVLAQYNGEREKAEVMGDGIAPARFDEAAKDENEGVPEWARGE